MARLALLGGKPVRRTPWPYPPYAVIGNREKKLVMKALERGSLSAMASSPGERYWGFGMLKKLEEKICDYYKVKYSVTTNCCTAALHTALVAAGVGRGDEVIVTPWSFSSSAKAPLYVGAVPVFADIEDRTYGLDPADIERNITKYTKAIIVVHLFGHPARMDEIMHIAHQHKLLVIEDAAQAHGASYNGKKVGTIGDIGVLSFGASKQVTAGEGGVLMTNNARLAERAQLFRNHGEVWGGIKTKEELTGILGYGYIMDEMSAALCLGQMQSLPRRFREREQRVKELNRRLGPYTFLTPPVVEKGCTHGYYIYALQYDESLAHGVSRDVFVKALQAEGISVGAGYIEPLYWNPMYRWKVFYGPDHFPYNQHPRSVEYRKGDCPTVERLYQKQVIHTMWMHQKMKQQDIEDVVKAVEKVSENLDALQSYQAKK